MSSIESWGQEFSTVSSALFTFFNFLFNHSASKRNFWLAFFPQAPTDDRIRRPRHCPPRPLPHPASSAPGLFHARPLPHPASSTPQTFVFSEIQISHRHLLLFFCPAHSAQTILFVSIRLCSPAHVCALSLHRSPAASYRILLPLFVSVRLCSSVFDLARL